MTLQSHFWAYIRRKTRTERCIRAPNVQCSTVYNSQEWKQSKCPLTEEWIKKMRHTHIMEYYSAIEKNEIMPPAATWIDPETVTPSEVREGEIP